MRLGTSGSPLTAELNRLANNGEYPAMTAFLDAQGAANAWAGTTGLPTVGALNYIADPLRTKDKYKDIDGICNELAGTTGLDASDALATILHPAKVILDTRLGNAPAFYTDAATPRYNYPGYIYTNGTTGNYISVPDETALDITGDLDLRWYGAMDDWTPTALSALLAKWNPAQLSYNLSIAGDGKLYFYWSVDGSTSINKVSTVAVPFADGAVGWVRATIDVDNGASGNDVRFFTSTDGTNWTQLGTTVTTAGVTSIFSGTTPVSINAASFGNGQPTAGKVYRSQIFAGLTGTDKRLDVDLTTNVTSATYDQFTATTGQLCTIIGQNTLTNAGTAGSLLPVTVGSSTAADSNDAKFLDFTGTNYVYLPGVAANYLSVPDSADLDITGDIDIRVYLAADDWTPAASNTFLAKRTTGQWSFQFANNTSGNLDFLWTTDGSTNIQKTSTAAITTTDGVPLWVRVTLDVDNGAAGNDVKFYTSPDGTTWTQLGSTVTTAGTTSIYSGTAPVEIGSNRGGTSNMYTGKVFRAQIFNGIDGTKVLDVDTSVITSGADTYVVPTTYTGQAGAYFTGSGLSLNGVAGNYVSTPDANVLDITGDIDLQVKVAMTDWTPGAISVLLNKWSTSGNFSYTLYINTSGSLVLAWTSDGSTSLNATSVATGITDGTTKWVRATLDVNNGASGRDIKFFTSDNGSTWTQLGTTITQAGVTSIYSGTAALEVGIQNGAFPANGTFYEAIVKSGIDGYTVFDADFTQVSANALRMTESSINKAVVTLATTRYAAINRSTSGRKTVAVTQPTWLFGTDDYMEVNNRYMDHTTASENYVYLSGASGNYMSVPDANPLDITGDIDIQVKVAMDDWTPASSSYLLSKVNGGSGNYSYAIQLTATGYLVLAWSSNGTSFTNKQSTATVAATDGSTLWVRATLDVDNGASGNDVKFYTSTDGTAWTQLGSTVTTAGVTSIYSSTSQVEIGSFIGGSPSKGKFYRAIIKNGIDGTIVLDANTAVITSPSQTTFTSSSGNAYTVTINKSGVGTFVSTGNYLYLPGVGVNRATAPDSAALDVTGDIDLRVKIAPDDWTPSATSALITKVDPQYSYFLGLTTSGALAFRWSTDGGTGANYTSLTSTANISAVDGSTLWARATLDVNNGAGGYDLKFWTSTDGLAWTQLGTTVTGASITSIYSGTGLLEIGNAFSGTPFRGKFFRAQVLNGIGGTVAFDANFEGSITSLNQASFTESSSNAATVTINRTGSAYRSAGITAAGYLYPGATNTFANSAIDYLNFDATQSFTAVVAVRQWATPGAYRRYIAKQISGMNNAWGLMPDNVSFRVWSAIRDSGTEVNGGVVAFTQGDLSTLSMVTNRTTETLTSYSGATAGTPTSTVGKGSLALPGSMFIGTTPAGAPQDFEFVAAAVFRSALTAAQISQLSNYFQTRY